MYNLENCYKRLEELGMSQWIDQIKDAVQKEITQPNGNIKKWDKALAAMPSPVDRFRAKGLSKVTVSGGPSLNEKEIEDLKEALKQMIPWRKGPFDFFGITVDGEWRSDLKWDRIAPYLDDLHGRLVLDIGCGNGYYMFRAADAGAETVIGVDPTPVYSAQFESIKKYSENENVFLLPMGFEGLPEDMEIFDTVFAMGVFYHRKAPFDFLDRLKALLKPDGQLVLETLIIDGDENQVLVPPDRYARMKNVWFIPSAAAMEKWLKKSGFTKVKFCGSSKTTSFEQRCTDWMPGSSLSAFLDPSDPNKTEEGLPAPVRAVFTASK